MNNLQSVTCIFLAFAVGLGAFGAHGLKDVLEPRHLEPFRTGVDYHFIHALGALIVSVLPIAEKRKSLSIKLFLSGILLFSGSLYLLSLNSRFGLVTPLGGVFFIVAWVKTALDLKKS